MTKPTVVTPLIFQREGGTCGLACLAMVAMGHDLAWDLDSLEKAFPVSPRGLSLASLIRIAEDIGFRCRALKAGVEQLGDVVLPAILHWGHDHFVVLLDTRGGRFLINDPTKGSVELSVEQFTSHFSGVALELQRPTTLGAGRKPPAPLPLSALAPKAGLLPILGQILLVSLVLEIYAVIAPLFAQVAIDDVVASRNYHLLITLALGFGLLVIIQQSVSAFRSWIVIFLKTRLGQQLNSALFSHLLSLPWGYFQRRHIGDITARFNSVDEIQRIATGSFIEAVVDGIMVSITLLVIVLYSLPLALIVITTTAVYALFRALFVAKLNVATKTQLEHAARQNSFFLETLRGIETVKSHNIEGSRQAMWERLVGLTIGANKKVESWGVLYVAMDGLLTGIENILVVSFATIFIIEGSLSVGMLFAFLAYKLQFSGRAYALINRVAEFQTIRIHVDRLADIVSSQPEPSGTTSSQPRIRIESLATRGLAYRYGTDEPYVFQDISFSASRGEVIAIVGPSGCGKSTLLRCLLGLINPLEGVVLVNDQDIRTVGTALFRRSVSVVSQSDQLFSGSLRDNIAFFSNHIDDAHIVRCARLADIDAAIEETPLRYRTLVGDMGVTLSGGQKQRVLIARALYRSPDVLFLDEATSHLDIASEKRVLDGIRRLGITTLIAAHRRETVSVVDRVITLRG